MPKTPIEQAEEHIATKKAGCNRCMCKATEYIVDTPFGGNDDDIEIKFYCSTHKPIEIAKERVFGGEKK
jgi:hypothetical protein